MTAKREREREQEEAGQREHVVKFIKNDKGATSVLPIVNNDNFTAVCCTVVHCGSLTCSYNNYYEIIFLVFSS